MKIVNNGMTNSSMFKENGSVNLKKAVEKRFSSQENLANDLKYLIENNSTDETVKLWCSKKASELFSIYKAFKNEKIK